MIWQITSPYFCAGLEVVDGSVARAAPIIEYMVGWTDTRVRSYCRWKRWTVNAGRLGP